MTENRAPGSGFLPLEAELRLKKAVAVGSPLGYSRTLAIARVYRWIEQTYPEYLKPRKGTENV
jgi:hypothetical protein